MYRSDGGASTARACPTASPRYASDAAAKRGSRTLPASQAKAAAWSAHATREAEAAEQVGEAERADDHRSRGEQRGEVAGTTEEGGGERRVRQREDEQPGAGVVEERRCREDAERRRQGDENARERVDPLRREGSHDRGREVERHEQRGDGDRAAGRLVPLGDEQRHPLRRRGRDACDEEPRPAAPEAHDRDRGEHERGERRSEHLDAALDPDRRRRECRADETDPREDLRRPRERDRGPDGGDRRGEDEGGGVVDEVVAGGGGEERRVAAREPRADRGERRVELPVAPPRDDTGGHEQPGHERTGEDALGGADPAAVDREHEQEDDAEQGHDPAGDGERACVQQLGEGRTRTARGGLAHGPGRSAAARAEPAGPAVRPQRPRVRRPGPARARRGRGGHEAPELGDLTLERAKTGLRLVEASDDGRCWSHVDLLRR